MRRLLLLIALAGCARAPFARGRTLGAGTLTDRASTVTQAGAGTVTVAAGYYVTGYAATADTASMTVTVTPCGPDIASCTANPVFTVPSGQSYSQQFKGSPDELGDGTTITIGAGGRVVVALWKYN